VQLREPSRYAGGLLHTQDSYRSYSLRRSDEHAEFNDTRDVPSYRLMRHLGYQDPQILGESQENRRVLDQAMDKDGIEIDREIGRSVSNLFE